MLFAALYEIYNAELPQSISDYLGVANGMRDAIGVDDCRQVRIVVRESSLLTEPTSLLGERREGWF